MSEISIWEACYSLSNFGSRRKKDGGCLLKTFLKFAIGHFRVLLCLGWKTSLSAKPFLWKWVLNAVSFSCKSVIFKRIVSHLDSLWNRGTRELGNGLFNTVAFKTLLKNKHFLIQQHLLHPNTRHSDGKGMASSYANIFLAKFEKDAITHALHQPHTWWRFIDDTLMIWTHTEDELRTFITYINKHSHHYQINFIPFSNINLLSWR